MRRVLERRLENDGDARDSDFVHSGCWSDGDKGDVRAFARSNGGESVPTGKDLRYIVCKRM